MTDIASRFDTALDALADAVADNNTAELCAEWEQIRLAILASAQGRWVDDPERPGVVRHYPLT